MFSMFCRYIQRMQTRNNSHYRINRMRVCIMFSLHGNIECTFSFFVLCRHYCLYHFSPHSV